MTMKTHKASCHCGAVKVEAEIDLAAGTARCNCSICAKSRWWGISTDPKSLRVVQGEDGCNHRYARPVAGDVRLDSRR